MICCVVFTGICLLLQEHYMYMCNNKTAAVLDAGKHSQMLQLTMRNNFHVVETEAVAELEKGHPHQNLARCSVATLPVLSLLKKQTMKHFS